MAWRVAAGLGAVIAVAGVAAKPTPPAQSAALDALKACRSTTDSAARLACYDGAVGKLLDAEAKRDVVVVDREQIRQARRSLFGLTLPDFKIFGDDEKGAKAAKEDDVDRLETTLVSALPGGDGRYLFVLAEGQRWQQIDDNDIPRKMHPGDKVVVQRAALGSFKLAVGNNLPVRVHRLN